jgi:hypothetical protein
MTDAPTHVHGYAIVCGQETRGHGIDRAGLIILVDKGPDYPHRWVTAWLGLGDQDWTWGHYFITEASARDDFAWRCRRGY